jgi:hypothetical protein
MDHLEFFSCELGINKLQTPGLISVFDSLSFLKNITSLELDLKVKIEFVIKGYYTWVKCVGGTILDGDKSKKTEIS